MANYLVDSTDLTSVADAIRTKGGTSAQLAFPADFVSAINAISGGGGSSGYETGTLTIAATTRSISVTVAKRPTFFVVYATTKPTVADSLVWAVYQDYYMAKYIAAYMNTSIALTAMQTGNSYLYDSNNNTFELTSSSRDFVSGITYNWFAWEGN